MRSSRAGVPAVPPRGRDAVMAAILDAAGALLVERSPREVTVRDVAERARVNHALVHRHFGTKDQLLRAVLINRSEAFGRAAAGVGLDAKSMLALLTRHADYWRILARFVLDAPDLLTDLPAGAMVLARMGGKAPGNAPDQDSRTAAAVAGSLALGWAVFGTHLDEVLGHPDEQRVRELVAGTVRELLTAPAQAPAVRVSRAGSSRAAGSASRGSNSRSTGSPRSSRSGR